MLRASTSPLPSSGSSNITLVPAALLGIHVASGAIPPFTSRMTPDPEAAAVGAPAVEAPAAEADVSVIRKRDTKYRTSALTPASDL